MENAEGKKKLNLSSRKLGKVNTQPDITMLSPERRPGYLVPSSFCFPPSSLQKSTQFLNQKGLIYRRGLSVEMQNTKKIKKKSQLK